MKNFKLDLEDFKVLCRHYSNILDFKTDEEIETVYNYYTEQDYHINIDDLRFKVRKVSTFEEAKELYEEPEFITEPDYNIKKLSDGSYIALECSNY
jgi:hypothetical protein